MTAIKKTIYAGLSCALLFVTACDRRPVSVRVNPETYSMVVTGLSVNFVDSTDKILVRWNQLDTNAFSFYQLYKGTDPANLTTTELSRNINKNQTSFQDIPEISDNVYYYAIAAVRVDGFDTTHGDLSLLDSVRLGDALFFNINRGDLFTSVPQCSLIIDDGNLAIASVRFTNTVNRYFVKTKTGEKFLANKCWTAQDPLSNADFDYLVSHGFMDNGGKLIAIGDAVTDSVVIPDFGVAATGGDHPMGLLRRNATLWTLAMGNGVKRVYARVEYKNGAIDTLVDGINITPYQIDLDLRNDITANNKSMRIILGSNNRQPTSPSIPYYYIYKPFVDFSIANFSDTTIADTFSYWIVTPKNGTTIAYDPLSGTGTYETQAINTGEPWVETFPESGRLTGIGLDHDASHIYTYAFDSISPEGIKHIASLRVTTEEPKKQTDGYAFRLRGIEPLSEIAIPGSYWGPRPVTFGVITTNSTLKSVQTIDNTGSASEQYKKVAGLVFEKQVSSGKKEFLMVARFTGRFFNDTRTVMCNFKRNGNLRAHSYFDFYPPKLNMVDVANANYICNGSLITTVFDYNLAQGANYDASSVEDYGYANISSIDLIIAKPTEAMALAWDSLGGRDLSKPGAPRADSIISSPALMTPEQMLALPHHTFPYTLKKIASTAAAVRWEGIDPTKWPSGKYLFGIIVSDEFGNRGFGVVGAVPGLPTNTPPTIVGNRNPFIVDILSGM